MESVPKRVKPTFLAVVLCLPEDGAPYEYFVKSKDDLNATSGPDFQIALVPRIGNDGMDNFKKLFAAEGQARYPGLKRGDLPCVWVEDNQRNHFIVPLYSNQPKTAFTQEQTRDALRDLIDLAAEAASAVELEAGFRGRHPHGEPDDPDPPPPRDASPLGVLQSAIQAVPAVRYALGVAGIGAAGAILMAFFSSPGKALFATIAVFVMMILLLVFSVITRAGGALMYPGLFLAWAMTLLFVASLSALVSSVFFKYPMPFSELMQQFQPVSRVRTTILVTQKSDKDKKPIAGATVMVKGAAFSGADTTAPDGTVVFSGVPSSEHLVATVTATGFLDGKIAIDASDGQATHTVALDPKPAAPPPKPVPTRQSSVALGGTWQIQIPPDINNARIKEGTFQFSPQDDGEILVSANFRADEMDTTLTGYASMAGTQIYLQYDAKNSAGGSWHGKASFTLSQGHLNGRFQLKDGERVPLALKKLR